MNALQASDFTSAWVAKLQAAGDIYPAVSFDGRTALPTWLVESARDQAERVFLVFDATPVERRDLGWAEQFVETSGLAFLTAWQNVIDAFGVGPEPWAVDAAKRAAEAYRERLDELGPSLHAGGRA